MLSDTSIHYTTLKEYVVMNDMIIILAALLDKKQTDQVEQITLFPIFKLSLLSLI